MDNEKYNYSACLSRLKALAEKSVTEDRARRDAEKDLKLERQRLKRRKQSRCIQKL